jgi:hypothetical protein
MYVTVSHAVMDSDQQAERPVSEWEQIGPANAVRSSAASTSSTKAISHSDTRVILDFLSGLVS